MTGFVLSCHAQVYHGDPVCRWGTVCSEGFTAGHAKAACRTVGHTGGRVSNKRAAGGTGLTYQVNGAACTLGQTDVRNCLLPGKTSLDTCREHQRDVGVQCRP